MVNLGCFVLWRTVYIPSKLPTLPPSTATVIRVTRKRADSVHTESACFITQFSRKFCHHHDGGDDLKRQKQRDSDGEFGMLRLVAHCVHTQQTAHASAQRRNGHQGRFRNAPEFFLCLVLVRKHKHKTGRIDCNEVKKEKIFHTDFLSGGIFVKKLWILLALASLLCGCAAEETLETVSDDIIQPVMAQPGEISVRLPDNAVAPVLESDSEQVYLSEDYEIIVETVSGGDLSATIQRISGYTPDNLTVMETAQDGAKRYDFVWASAGENGDQLGRAVILDDGNYHYCLSVLRDADTTEKSQIVWRDVFDSFKLI